MTNIERIDLLEKNLERQIRWISAAEAKIAPIVAIDIAMLGVLAAMAAKVGLWEWYSLIISMSAALLLVISLAFLLLAKFPRTSGPKDSCIFFCCIARESQESYAAKILVMNQEQYLTDLISQVHRNAQIDEIKYRCIKWAMGFLFADVLFWLSSVWILFMIT